MVHSADGRPDRERDEIVEPGERVHQPTSMSTWALALLLPFATALLLVPFREDHGRALAIVLVLPVVAVAAAGSLGPAVLAAASAGISFDLLLTEPYGRLVIDDPDDIVAAATLVAVAVAVGVIATRRVQALTANRVRRDELRHLLGFVRLTTETRDPVVLAHEVCRHLEELLDLRECRWHEGYTGEGAVTLLPNGAVVGRRSEMHPDRAMLPEDLELPARSGHTEFGRFVLKPRQRRATSLEERLTAATLATLFAATLGDTDT